MLLQAVQFAVAACQEGQRVWQGTLKEYLWIWQALFLLSGQDVQGRTSVCSEMESLRKIVLLSSSIHYPPVKTEQ